MDVSVRPVDDVSQALYGDDAIDVLQATDVDMQGIVRQGAGAGGPGGLRYCDRGHDLAMAGKVDALVTSAINKESLNLAGHPYDGHTVLAFRTGAKKVAMMLTAGDFR